MAIDKCLNCGRFISDTDLVCPKCFDPIDPSPATDTATVTVDAQKIDSITSMLYKYHDVIPDRIDVDDLCGVLKSMYAETQRLLAEIERLAGDRDEQYEFHRLALQEAEQWKHKYMTIAHPDKEIEQLRAENALLIGRTDVPTPDDATYDVDKVLYQNLRFIIDQEAASMPAAEWEVQSSLHELVRREWAVASNGHVYATPKGHMEYSASLAPKDSDDSGAIPVNERYWCTVCGKRYFRMWPNGCCPEPGCGGTLTDKEPSRE